MTAKAKGKATIKATATDGSNVYASCPLIVSTPCPSGAVDLGMTTPDGYKLYWATCNICTSGFVSSPEKYGDYYAWGETAPYYSTQNPLTWKSGKTAGYSLSSYKWCKGSFKTLTKYNTDSSNGTVDNKTVLEASDDAAHKTLGGKWRMPTDAEWTDLRTKCTWTLVTDYNGTGVHGQLVTGTNGKNIFIPGAGYRTETYLDYASEFSHGYYWSSSLKTDAPSLACGVSFVSSVLRCWVRRVHGYSIRPVSE